MNCNLTTANASAAANVLLEMIIASKLTAQDGARLNTVWGSPDNFASIAKSLASELFLSNNNNEGNNNDNISEKTEDNDEI